MSYATYVINLAQASERLTYIKTQLDQQNISFERIDAVLGDLLTEPIPDYNEKNFHQLFGKQTNKRVVGCYFSHIKAFRTFLKSEEPYALILEDDATIPADFTKILDEAMTYSKQWDLLRLSSFREGKFLVFGDLSGNRKISYNTQIVKNTAAYLINRKAAECCVQKMLPMFLPYDIALDREWNYGFKAACIHPFPVTQRKEIESQIPRGTKIKKYRFLAKMYNIYTHIQRRRARKTYFKQLQQIK